MAKSGKAFRTLLDGIYTNKVRAIVREINANAEDSHIMAGQTLPWLVHLPSYAEPWFSVRDYGTSMSDRQVMKLYTTLFDSPKDGDSNQTGAFGLGSKTPFCLVYEFTVTCWQNGKERKYLAEVDLVTDIPKMTKIHEIDSGEPQGVEVRLEVPSNKFDEFAEEMQRVGKGFDLKPGVAVAKDHPGFEFEEDEPIISVGDWGIYQGSEDSIHQGCVIYPVTQDQLRHDRGMTAAGYSVRVRVPNGQVDIAANREAIQLTPRTEALVKQLLQISHKSAVEEAQARVAAAPTQIEAMSLRAEFRKVFPNAKWKWQGIELTNTIDVNKDPAVGLGIPLHPTVDLKFENPPPCKPEKRARTGRFDYPSIDGTTFLINDGSNPIRRNIRIKAYIDDPANQRSVWHPVQWDPNGGYITTGKPTVVMVIEPTKDQIKRLKLMLGLRDDQVMLIQDLPDPGPPPPKPTTGTGYTGPRSGVYEVMSDKVNYTYNTCQTLQAVARDDMTKTYFWLPFVRNGQRESLHLDFGNGVTRSIEVDDVRNLRGNIAGFGLTSPVYMMTPKAVERIKPDPSRRYDRVIGNTIVKHKDEILKRAWWSGYAEGIRTGESWKQDLVEELTGTKVPNERNVYDLHRRILGTTAIEEAKNRGLDAGVSALDRLKDQYPLLFSTTGDINERLDHAREYVNLIDGQTTLAPPPVVTLNTTIGGEVVFALVNALAPIFPFIAKMQELGIDPQQLDEPDELVRPKSSPAPTAIRKIQLKVPKT